MNEEELRAHLAKLKAAGASDETLVAEAEYQHQHRFKSPTVAATVEGTSEKILPGPEVGGTGSPRRTTSLPRQIGGAVTTFGHGAPIVGPWTDEATGALNAILHPLHPIKGYREGRQQARGLLSEYRTEHPTGAKSAATAGFLAGIPATAALLPEALAGAGMGTGAALGGVQALGDAEGSPKHQLLQTGVGAGAGALMSGILSKTAKGFGGAPLGTGALVRAAKVGGTDLQAALAERASLPPEIRAATPAIHNAGTEEVGLLSRTLRTKRGTILGRTVENQLAGLETVKGKIGKEFARFTGGEGGAPIPVQLSPELEQVLSVPETKAQRAVIANAWARVPKSRWIGGETFKGTVADALDRKLPLSGDLQVALDNAKTNMVRAQVLTARVEIPVPRQPTTEFLWRLHQEVGGRMRAKPTDVGVLGDFQTQIEQSLENSLPGSNELFARYHTANNVIDQTAAKTGAIWDDVAKRWVVKAHTGGPQAAPYEVGHAVVNPASPYGAAAAIRRISPSVARPQERWASEALLQAGEKGTGLLQSVLQRSQPTKRPLISVLGAALGGRLPGMLFPQKRP